MCVEHINSPLHNAKTKIEHIYTGLTTSKIYENMINCDQDGQLMVNYKNQIAKDPIIIEIFRYTVQKCIQQKIAHFSKCLVEL